MAKLEDYSGEFEPGFNLDRFSKPALLKLIKAYSDYLIKVDAYWFLTVLDKWGNDAAVECDINILKNLSKPYEVKAVDAMLNIKGNDVATLMKAIQVSPWGQAWERRIDLKNKNYATLTTPVCPTLLALEKEGRGRELSICQVCGHTNLGTQAQIFNKKIKVNPLKLPPRKSKDDIACTWEFTLEE
jgi:hypothetical protein